MATANRTQRLVHPPLKMAYFKLLGKLASAIDAEITSPHGLVAYPQFKRAAALG